MVENNPGYLLWRSCRGEHGVLVRGRLISRGRTRGFIEYEASQGLTVARGPAAHSVMPRPKKRFCATLRPPPLVNKGGRALEAAVTGGSLP